MHQPPLSSYFEPTLLPACIAERYIYIACPWTPVGGGMFKVADCLIQSQAGRLPADAARLLPLAAV
jgi:hypothetical protein